MEDRELTHREREVLRLMVTGASNTEIGRVLHISPKTVKTHARTIYSKLRVSNRTAAAVHAEREGLV